ncbi:MAG: phospholipid carrier-dependent glycosyltransferase [Ottowia sp.]|uniref:phospholipid carrier-dependent glycosyltransferase n=1 Tax=Ottowia sp. TaxID=1898956 RepID=UPI003C78C68A
MIKHKVNQVESKARQKTLRPATWLLVLILLLGAWLRLDVTLKTTVVSPLRADALGYFSYAYNLRHFGIYSRDHSFTQGKGDSTPKPDALQPPGYPFLLLPFAGEVPDEETILHITQLQALLGIFVILFTYITAKEFLGKTWALLPSLLVAISPQLINCEVYILSESLFTFLMMAAIACLVIQINRHQNQLLLLLGGILLGAAALTRPTLSYIVPFLLLGLLPLLPKSARWKWAITLSLGFALLTVPWAMRNWLTLGGSDPALTINTIVHGHYPGAMYKWNPQSLGYPYRYDPDVAQLSSSLGAALQGIMARMATEPLTYFIWYFFGKPFMFFSWNDIASAGEFFTYPTPVSPYHEAPLFLASKSFMRTTHYLWILLAIVATLASAMKAKSFTQEITSRPSRLLSIFFIYFLLVHIAGFPLARYSIPLLPVIFILATSILFELMSQYRQKSLGCIETPQTSH